MQANGLRERYRWERRKRQIQNFKNEKEFSGNYSIFMEGSGFSHFLFWSQIKNTNLKKKTERRKTKKP